MSTYDCEMNRRLLELIICPECKGALDVQVFDARAGGGISKGMLTCSACERDYPIIEAIPRLLPDTLWENLFSYHGEFFSRYQVSPRINRGHRTADEVHTKQKTYKSFSYQWNAFGQIFKEYRQHWKEYLPDAVDESYFKGKTGLDAGCGFGRHTIQAAEAGAEIVGMDLSEAVKAAYANTQHLDHVHIVQGDIYNPPFRKGTFDFVYSLGVLHHLPNPQWGFDTLANLLESKQEIFVWCYSNKKPRKHAAYEFIRRYTTHMDFGSLYIMTLVAAFGIRLFLNYPTMLFRQFGMEEKQFPYDYYLAYPFQVLHADLFDVFSVPSTNYYGATELESWFTNAHLNLLQVKHSVSGFTLHGQRNH